MISRSPVDPSALPNLPSLLSEPRFATYLDHCEGHADHAARLYVWNVELTAAFWGPISIVEVVVRNSVHDAMRMNRADDWWNLPTVRLMRRERQPRVEKAFPFLGGRRRKQLHRELDDVRRFRNRLAHHEPIFRAPIERLRDDLIGIAGYVHPEAARLISECQRIDQVLARKHEAIRRGKSSL
ncbi:hypothetical protein B7R54_01070 [Subtercola boreus]|uniref:Abi-like protein n=1 Tax=Subtercola boreus TaxID=120213 RepID=A0A3E0VN36_9MICO|nr:hypothetical protein B7R54_01070 [Subtercola boreus]